MQETIGKIVLDETFYPGEDLYSDGAVEDEILDIVKTYSASEYGRIIEERASWPLFYHLSNLRTNIIDWIPKDKKKKVLEVGSGCGAITGALADKFGSVTGIDLSRKRSTINAYRNSHRDNVKICVGNFKDIEGSLDCGYDYIFLIGVFEYGSGYMGGETPYEDFLNILKKHLSKDGSLVIAIENRLGMKYFAGCKEDHSGRFFDGMENYPEFNGAKTFSKVALEKILNSCGINEYKFFYPYPDYKFPNRIFSDSYLPTKGDLYDNIRNFDRERMILFDEGKAFDSMTDDGLFSLFSNSFMVITGPAPDTEYVKYSNENRNEKYGISTEIGIMGNERRVIKKALSEKAVAHIDSIATKYELLMKKYEGSGLEINKCVKFGPDKVAFEFVEGQTLSSIMADCVKKNDKEGFLKLYDRFVYIAEYNSEFKASDYDLIFENIIVNGDSWTLIDYEWTFEEKIEPGKIIDRALYVFSMGNEERKKIKDWLKKVSFDSESVRMDEQKFQEEVCKDKMAASTLRHNIGNGAFSLDYILDHSKMSKNRIQVYEDYGKGFNEDKSYFIENIVKCGEEVTFDIKLNQDLTKLRVDPSHFPCVVIIREATLEGENILSLIASGKTNGKRKGRNVLIFGKEDPNFSFKVSGFLKGKETATITFKMRISELDVELAGIVSG